MRAAGLWVRERRAGVWVLMREVGEWGKKCGREAAGMRGAERPAGWVRATVGLGAGEAGGDAGADVRGWRVGEEVAGVGDVWGAGCGGSVEAEAEHEQRGVRV